MENLPTTEEIIARSESLNLYKNLILQLNKDFQRAAIDDSFSEGISPSDLKIKLHKTVFQLLQNHYSKYLNLLYIIDVSEEKIKNINTEDTLEISEEMAYLILLREWQKVWFKEKFK